MSASQYLPLFIKWSARLGTCTIARTAGRNVSCGSVRLCSYTITRCMKRDLDYGGSLLASQHRCIKRFISITLSQPANYRLRPYATSTVLLHSQMQWHCLSPLRDAKALSKCQHMHCFSAVSQNSIENLQPTKSLICRRRNVGTGRSSHHNDINGSFNFSHTRKRLKDRTRLLLKGRVARLKTSLTQHNVKLKDKFSGDHIKSVLAVGKLRRKFRVQKLKEDVRTIPNLLTSLRMASAPLLAYLVVNESFALACGLFVAAGITDMLDGYIARNFKNQRTALGTALDPLADKLLVSFLTVSLTSVDLIPVPLTVLILSRDIGLIAASFYIRYISLAPPKTLTRYFDVSHVTAKLYPSNISKLNTVLQLSYVAATLASPVFNFVGHPALQGIMYATATTTFLSGADYVLTWRRRLKIIKNK